MAPGDNLLDIAQSEELEMEGDLCPGDISAGSLRLQD